MAPHNKRFPQQWEIITKHVDFKGKSVIDLGCGYGDMMLGVAQAGGWATGIEGDPVIANNARLRSTAKEFAAYNINIEWLIKNEPWNSSAYNVAVCFSVLPYLENQEGVMEWMASHAGLSLLEVQYLGDGPGQIDGPLEMITVLQKYWHSALPIGFTTVEYRNVNRTIWLCE